MNYLGSGTHSSAIIRELDNVRRAKESEHRIDHDDSYAHNYAYRYIFTILLRDNNEFFECPGKNSVPYYSYSKGK